MSCERLEGLKRLQVKLQQDQRVLRTALHENTEPEDEDDLLLGKDWESEIPSAIRAIAQT
jgi:hypothetical protein